MSYLRILLIELSCLEFVFVCLGLSPLAKVACFARKKKDNSSTEGAKTQENMLIVNVMHDNPKQAELYKLTI